MLMESNLVFVKYIAVKIDYVLESFYACMLALFPFSVYTIVLRTRRCTVYFLVFSKYMLLPFKLSNPQTPCDGCTTTN